MKLNKIMSVFMSAVFTVMMVGSAFAQGEKDDFLDLYYTSPIVPLETAVKGRQAVVDYVHNVVDHVEMHFSGNSIVSTGWQNNRYFDSGQLKSLGYINRGVFSELSSALANIGFSAQVIKTPDGQYDIRVEVVYYAKDNRVLMQGNGWLYVTENPDGTLSTGSFWPSMYLKGSILVDVANTVTAAKWIGKNGQSKELAIFFYDDVRRVSLPARYLDSGYLLFSDYNGNVSGWDLDSKGKLSGKQIAALIGTSYSSEIRILDNPSVIDAGYSQFYKDWSGIYGRFQLIELLTGDDGFKDVVSIQVPIWGTTAKVSPSKMFFKPLVLRNGDRPGFEVGKEVEVLRGNGDYFFISLPAGKYHLRTEFDGIIDPEANPYGYGKG
jgi:hypothetical protein